MDSHALTNINRIMCSHRSPSVDQQNSASTVETDQPEDPAVGTKRIPGSKIVLPSSDVVDYCGLTLRGTIARIVNPEGMIFDFISCRMIFLLSFSCRFEGHTNLQEG